MSYNALVRLNEDGSFSLVEMNRDGKTVRHANVPDGNWFAGKGKTETDAIHDGIARSGLLDEFHADGVDITIEEFQNVVYVVRADGWIKPVGAFEWNP